jgi:hypothetical protein
MELFMENSSVSFKYEGDNFSDNKFEIKELGIIFESLGELFESTNKALNKDMQIQVKIDSKFIPGSFEFVIELQRLLANTVIPTLAGTDMSAMINLYTIVSIIFGNQKSLLELLRFLKGTLPKKVENANENVLVYRNDDVLLEVKKEAMILFEDKKVRKALGIALANSLSKSGTDSVQIEAKEVKTKVLKDEKDFFAYLQENDEEIIDTETMETELEIVGISFDPEKKWEFKNYRETFFAEIVCKIFKGKIESGEVFQKGDKLKTILQTEYYKTQQQIRKKRTILEVLDHIKPPIQGELF